MPAWVLLLWLSRMSNVVNQAPTISRWKIKQRFLHLFGAYYASNSSWCNDKLVWKLLVPKNYRSCWSTDSFDSCQPDASFTCWHIVEYSWNKSSLDLDWEGCWKCTCWQYWTACTYNTYASYWNIECWSRWIDNGHARQSCDPSILDDLQSISSSSR